MNLMIELLGYSALSLLVIKYFEPIQPVREAFIEAGIRLMIKGGLWPLQYLFTVLSCPKCFSFWFTWGYTQNIWYASIVAIVTYITDLTIEKLNEDGTES